MTGARLRILAALPLLLAARAGADEFLPDPAALRQLEVRDRVLLGHAWGRALNEAYYRMTPLAELPLALPERRPQKLALLCVSGADDAANLDTYLSREGYLADRCATREALVDRLRAGGYTLVVVEVDPDRERPDEVARALVRAHPRLRRGVLCAVRTGAGKGLPPRALRGTALVPLPLTDPKALLLALQAARASPAPWAGLCLLIRLGSSPALVAGGLLLAALLLAASLASLLPRRGRVSTVALVAAGLCCLAAAGLSRGGVPEPERKALGRMAALRSRALAFPGTQLPSAEVDFLAEAIDAPSRRLRREAAYTWAVAAMACPGNARRIDHLLRALDEREDPEDPRQRQWAAVALGWSGDAAAVPRLIKALADPSFLVRNKAAVALGQLRDGRAIVPLLQMTREDLWYNAESARESLRRLGR